MSEQTKAPSRGRKTVGDMVRSLSVVLVLVGIIVAFNLAQQPERVVRHVDYQAALDGARSQASYDVLGPDPVPDGWQVTSARSERSGGGVTWHVGLVTDTEEYAGLEQSDGDRSALLDAVVQGARSAGSVDVAGQAWQRLVGGDPEPRGLVRAEAGVTTVVAGSAPWGELEQLASALRS